MKKFIKALLYRVAPRWSTAQFSARARAHSHRVIASWGNSAVTRKLVAKFGSTVIDGPFEGVVLTPMAHAEQLGPYILGIYESELDAAWEAVFRGDYTQVIDIGARFGYYAIGLARRYPAASVIAFDTDWWARKAIHEMIVANGTRNVLVEGFCSAQWLAQNTHDGAFIISDCEGYESVLFDGNTISNLRSVTLIIETHDAFVPGVSDRLKAAFASSHIVQVFGENAARREPAHALDFLAAHERQLAVQEVRRPQLWLLCVPKPVSSARPD